MTALIRSSTTPVGKTLAPPQVKPIVHSPFNAREYLIAEIYRARPHLRLRTTWTPDEIRAGLLSSGVQYNTCLRVCILECLCPIHDLPTHTRLGPDSSWKHLQRMTETSLWGSLLNAMSVPFYRNISEHALATWVRPGVEPEFLALILSDATAQLLRFEARFRRRNGNSGHFKMDPRSFGPGKLDLSNLHGSTKCVSAALSCEAGRSLASSLGFEDTSKLVKWLGARDRSSPNILGKRAWLFDGKMVLPKDLELDAKESTIGPLLQRATYAMSRLWLFLTHGDMNKQPHLNWSESLKEIQDQSIPDPKLCRRQIFAYILRNDTKLVGMMKPPGKLPHELWHTFTGTRQLMTLLPSIHRLSEWDTFLEFCEERGFMRHQVLWDTYYDFRAKLPEKTTSSKSAEAGDAQLRPQIIIWRSGEGPSDEPGPTGGACSQPDRNKRLNFRALCARKTGPPITPLDSSKSAEAEDAQLRPQTITWRAGEGPSDEPGPTGGACSQPDRNKRPNFRVLCARKTGPPITPLDSSSEESDSQEAPLPSADTEIETLSPNGTQNNSYKAIYANLRSSLDQPEPPSNISNRTNHQPATPSIETINYSSDSTIQSGLAPKQVNKLPEIEPGNVTNDVPDLRHIILDDAPAVGSPETLTSLMKPSSSHSTHPTKIQDHVPKSNLQKPQITGPEEGRRDDFTTSQKVSEERPRATPFTNAFDRAPSERSTIAGASSTPSSSTNKRKEPPPSDHATTHKRPRIDGAMPLVVVSVAAIRPIVQTTPTINSTSTSEAASNASNGIIESWDRMEAVTANVNTMLKGLIEMCGRVRKI